MSTTKSFPRQLRALRLAYGLTQVSAARIIKVRPNTVARWERRERFPLAAMRAWALGALREYHERKRENA